MSDFSMEWIREAGQLLIRFSTIFHVYLIIKFLIFVIGREWLFPHNIFRRSKLLRIVVLELVLWLSIFAILLAQDQIRELFKNGGFPGATWFTLPLPLAFYFCFIKHPFWGPFIIVGAFSLPIIFTLIYERKKWWLFSFMSQFFAIYLITLFVYFDLWRILFQANKIGRLF